jgi:hypothetical protein
VGILPIESFTVTQEQTGATLETGFVGELHSGALLAPRVAAGRAGERAGFVDATLAYVLIQAYMRLRMNPVAD